MVERYNVDVEKNDDGYWEGVLLISANGAWVSHSDYADLERQIAELRAEIDQNGNLSAAFAREDAALNEIAELRAELINRVNYWSELYSKEYHRAEDAEAENARLRALPLKDEVERVVEGLRVYAASLRGQHSTRNEVADELDRLARALLSRLRAGEQEGWRPISDAPKDGTAVILYAAAWEMSWGIQIGHFEGDGEGGGQWVTGEGAVEENDPDFDPDAEVEDDLDPDGNWDENMGPTHWMPLPASPSVSEGGSRG